MQCEEKPRLCFKKKKNNFFNINRDSPLFIFLFFFKKKQNSLWQLKLCLLGGMRDFQHFLFVIAAFSWTVWRVHKSLLRIKLTEKRLLSIQGRFYSFRNDAGYHVNDRREKNKKNISMECLLFTFSIFET